jgi:putative redox protein
MLRGNMPRNVFVNSGSVTFVQNISVGPHAFQADEPSANGGNDAGPESHELLLAALGACASITVQMYAHRKQWPVEGVHVHLSYGRVPSEGQSGAKIGMGNAIEMGISFSGDLSEDQRRRLLEIAGRCPVHRILTSQVEIRTNLLITSSPSVTGPFVGNDQRSGGKN